MILVTMGTTPFIFLIIGILLAGGVAGFFIARKIFQDQLKKNPPISEKQIRVMLTAMGRKPSEAQVRQIMNSMKNQ